MKKTGPLLVFAGVAVVTWWALRTGKVNRDTINDPISAITLAAGVATLLGVVLR